MISAIKSFVITTLCYCGVVPPTILPPTQTEQGNSALSQDYVKPFGLQDKIALSLGLHNSSYLAYCSAIPLALCLYNSKWSSSSLKFLGVIGTSSLAAAIGARIVAPKFPTEVERWRASYSAIHEQSSSKFLKVVFLDSKAYSADTKKLAEEATALGNQQLPPIPKEWQDVQKATYNAFKGIRGKSLYYLGFLLPVGVSAWLFYALNIPNRLHTTLGSYATTHESLYQFNFAFNPQQSDPPTLNPSSEISRNISYIANIADLTMRDLPSHIPSGTTADGLPLNVFKSGHFSNLPLEIKSYIFQHLNPESLVNLRLVSQECRALVDFILAGNRSNVLYPIIQKILPVDAQRHLDKKKWALLNLNPSSRLSLVQHSSKFTKKINTPLQPFVRAEICLTFWPLTTAAKQEYEQAALYRLMNPLGKIAPQEVHTTIFNALGEQLPAHTLGPDFFFNRPSILDSLYQSYQHKIILSPMFKKLRFDLPNLSLGDQHAYNLEMLESALQLLHPDCNFTNLAIKSSAFLPNQFEILQYFISKTIVNGVQKIKKLEVFDSNGLHVVNFFNGAIAPIEDLLSEFLGQFQKLVLHIDARQLENTPKTYTLHSPIPFQRITQNQSLKIILDHGHSNFLAQSRISLPWIHNSNHSLANISIWANLPPSDEFVQQIITAIRNASAPELKRVDFYNAPNGELMQHIHTRTYNCTGSHSEADDTYFIDAAHDFLTHYNKWDKNLEIFTVFPILNNNEINQFSIKSAQELFADLTKVIIHTNLVPSPNFISDIKNIQSSSLKSVKFHNVVDGALLQEIVRP